MGSISILCRRPYLMDLICLLPCKLSRLNSSWSDLLDKAVELTSYKRAIRVQQFVLGHGRVRTATHSRAKENRKIQHDLADMGQVGGSFSRRKLDQDSRFCAVGGSSSQCAWSSGSPPLLRKKKYRSGLFTLVCVCVDRFMEVACRHRGSFCYVMAFGYRRIDRRLRRFFECSPSVFWV
ncbi:hypothetical protein BDV59DRAFT_2446 [Aspergillus ambiguus]|uniref:uncharacterized protein n=1 Tax=Aspergillus ambiguus TaxID=176160 RepID=UPI003CCD410F